MMSASASQAQLSTLNPHSHLHNTLHKLKTLGRANSPASAVTCDRGAIISHMSPRPGTPSHGRGTREPQS